MHAIIRKGNGEYYTSAMFGYYSDKKSEYNYGAYYIVLDETKEHLNNPGLLELTKLSGKKYGQNYA